MPLPSCILCGPDTSVFLYPATVRESDVSSAVFSARRMPDRLHGEIFRCRRCGLVYPRTFIDPAILGRLYKESTHTYGDMEYSISRTYYRYINRAVRLLDTDAPRSSVDIGCGNGFMLPIFQKMGFDAWGIEPSADAIAKADPSIATHILHGMVSENLLPPDRFDFLSCFQTLDHLQDPIGFVRLCLRTLKPGGVALFINHNIGGFTARLLGERCPMLDIEHTYLHTKRSMRMLCEKAGFTDIKVFSVRNNYPLWYWFYLLPIQSSWKKKCVERLKKMRLGNLTVPLFAGNLGLIARKPSSRP